MLYAGGTVAAAVDWQIWHCGEYHRGSSSGRRSLVTSRPSPRPAGECRSLWNASLTLPATACPPVRLSLPSVARSPTIQSIRSVYSYWCLVLYQRAGSVPVASCCQLPVKLPVFSGSSRALGPSPDYSYPSLFLLFAPSFLSQRRCYVSRYVREYFAVVDCIEFN